MNILTCVFVIALAEERGGTFFARTMSGAQQSIRCIIRMEPEAIQHFQQDRHIARFREGIQIYISL